MASCFAWGGGIGRSLIDDRGRLRSLFAIVSADSYSRPQYMLGYAWPARTRASGRSLRLSGGYTLLVIGRHDKLHYAPLPVMLPLGSVGTGRFEIVGAYVPGFEVGYFFARLRMKQRQAIFRSSKEGGFLGIGGTRVSAEEEHAIAEIATAVA